VLPAASVGGQQQLLLREQERHLQVPCHLPETLLLLRHLLLLHRLLAVLLLMMVLQLFVAGRCCSAAAWHHHLGRRRVPPSQGLLLVCVALTASAHASAARVPCAWTPAASR
jgi:hypothetical protein